MDLDEDTVLQKVAKASGKINKQVSLFCSEAVEESDRKTIEGEVCVCMVYHSSYLLFTIWEHELW